MVLFSAPLAWGASNQLNIYNSSNEATQTAALQWCLNVGKCTENPLLLGNGNILLTSSSKQLLVNPQGQILWESKSKSGNLGQAVIDPYR